MLYFHLPVPHYLHPPCSSLLHSILLENKLKIIRFLRSPISNQQSLPMTLALAQSHAVDQHLTLNAVSILIIQLCNHYATFVGMLSLPPLPTRDDSSPINISTHVQRRFAQFQDDDGLVHIIHFADLAELCILDIILNDVDGIQH